MKLNDNLYNNINLQPNKIYDKSLLVIELIIVQLIVSISGHILSK
jgi:hypothetical protein